MRDLNGPSPFSFFFFFAVLLSSLFFFSALGDREDGSEKGLKVGFYKHTCPQAERIVLRAVKRNSLINKEIPAGIIRLLFHDCWIRGCDASLLLERTPESKQGQTEDSNPANGNTLRGIEVIHEAKVALEAECPNTVSCADILSFAARDAVTIAGVKSYDVPAGRRDGMISRIDDTNSLPSPASDSYVLIAKFAEKGLTPADLVVLSGAHSIGGAHCPMFWSRLYNHSGTGLQDPTLDVVYAEVLKASCPRTESLPTLINQGLDLGDSVKIPFDVRTDQKLDASYYRHLMEGKGLLTSDQTLTNDERTSRIVKELLEKPGRWEDLFTKAMAKLSALGVLVGDQGEIRRDCRFVNENQGKSGQIESVQNQSGQMESGQPQSYQ